MIGCFIAGSLALFALSRLYRHRRWCRGGGCHHHGWHGGGGWGGGHGHHGHHGHGHGHGWDGGFELGGGAPSNDVWFGDDVPSKRHFIRAVLARVNATPAQQRAIGEAVDVFRDDLKKLGGGELRRSRQELSDALRRPSFDAVVMGEQFARHDTIIEGSRKAFVGLVARVHDALEPEQRQTLAKLVERGPRFGWWQ
jgi:hypothetical protein